MSRLNTPRVSTVSLRALNIFQWLGWPAGEDLEGEGSAELRSGLGADLLAAADGGTRPQRTMRSAIVGPVSSLLGDSFRDCRLAPPVSTAASFPGCMFSCGRYASRPTNSTTDPVALLAAASKLGADCACRARPHMGVGRRV
jgi:hypothetical protein